MDYPKWSWSAFTNYRLSTLGLKGLRVGGGVVETGPQEYASGFTHAGDALKDNSGLPLVLKTRVRWSVSLFAHYEFTVHEHRAYVQVNVDNVLDDQKRYGLIWAPGRSGSARFGITF
jgi:hypothetical protein